MEIRQNQKYSHSFYKDIEYNQVFLAPGVLYKTYKTKATQNWEYSRLYCKDKHVQHNCITDTTERSYAQSMKEMAQKLKYSCSYCNENP